MHLRFVSAAFTTEKSHRLLVGARGGMRRGMPTIYRDPGFFLLLYGWSKGSYLNFVRGASLEVVAKRLRKGYAAASSDRKGCEMVPSLAMRFRVCG